MLKWLTKSKPWAKYLRTQDGLGMSWDVESFGDYLEVRWYKVTDQGRELQSYCRVFKHELEAANVSEKEVNDEHK